MIPGSARSRPATRAGTGRAGVGPDGRCRGRPRERRPSDDPDAGGVRNAVRALHAIGAVPPTPSSILASRSPGAAGRALPAGRCRAARAMTGPGRSSPRAGPHPGFPCGRWRAGAAAPLGDAVELDDTASPDGDVAGGAARAVTPPSGAIRDPPTRCTPGLFAVVSRQPGPGRCSPQDVRGDPGAVHASRARFGLPRSYDEMRRRVDDPDLPVTGGHRAGAGRAAVRWACRDA